MGYCCSSCCLCKWFCAIIVASIITLIVVLIVSKPSDMKVHIEKATLLRFSLTDDNVLHYNLSLDLSLRNPNKRVGIYYDQIEAQALYNGNWFETVNLPAFYQGHKNTTMLYPAFNGQQLLQLDPKAISEFDRQKNEGVFNVQVKVYMKIRYRSKVWKIKSRQKPDATCQLNIPLGSGKGFPRTGCYVDFHIQTSTAF